MNTLRRVSTVIAGLIVLSSMLACGAVGKVQEAAKRAKTSNDLKQLALSYMNYESTHMKGPAGPDELLKFVIEPQEKALVELTRPGGEFVFYWNVKLGTLPAGSSNTVLGYERKVPAEGGLVVMADGSVQIKTPAEFNALAKPPEFKSKGK